MLGESFRGAKIWYRLAWWRSEVRTEKTLNWILKPGSMNAYTCNYVDKLSQILSVPTALPSTLPWPVSEAFQQGLAEVLKEP